MKRVIDLLEKADKFVFSISVHGEAGKNAESRDTANRLIQEAITLLEAPRRETPEQYRERTGKEWRDYWPVWYISDEEDPEWRGRSYREAKEMAKVNDTWIICANFDDYPPPDDWLPDETEKQKKRIHALERALKMAGLNITCWACEHIGKADFCNTCDTGFPNWSFNQEVFGKEE
jgi:hypothetical protein